MHQDRLLKTADHLDTVIRAKQELFDMTSWGYHVEGDGVCGTAGCAFGHACSIPEFQEAGLKLIPDTLLSRQRLIPVYSEDPEDPCPRQGIYAAKLFYGITYDQAEYLFTPERYKDEDRAGVNSDVTLDAVVRRLREFVASGGEVTTTGDDDE